jgi:hypothetical protein
VSGRAVFVVARTAYMLDSSWARDSERRLLLKHSRAARTFIAAILVIAVSLAAFAGSAAALAAPPDSWTVSRIVEAPTAVILFQLAVLGPNDVYAAGYRSAPAPVEGRVYHYNGTTWTVAFHMAQRFWSIAALDSAHIWAGGEAGVIKFFNGSTWVDQTVPTGTNIQSISALDQNHVWAVTDGGEIFFFNGTSWTGPATFPGTILQSVFALDVNHVWAVGNSGAILAWNGSTWINQSVGGSHILRSVSGLDTNCVWAVGDAGTVKFFNGTSWTDASVSTSDTFNGVSALDVNHVYVCGSGGRVYLWDGTSWQMMQPSSTITDELAGIAAIDTDHVYAVGWSSVFARGNSTQEAQNSTFYFAEGTCRPTFDPYICVQNPDGTTDANVTITYMLGTGTNITQTIVVPKSSRATVSVKSRLGSGEDAAHDFSAKVACTNGLPIIAERPMYFSYRSSQGVIITGGSDVIGALQPRPTFYFAEGTCRPNFDAYICIQNPNATASSVLISYMLGNGTNKTSSFSVGAHSRKTLAVKDTLGSGNDSAHDFSARVATTDGSSIVAERPMYFSYVSSLGTQITGGHDVVGAASPNPDFYFAEGTCRPNFDPYLCIQNPGPATAQVKITYMKGDGTNTIQALAVPAATRQTVTVKSVLGSANDAAHDFSAKVETTNGQRIIAERPMYFDYRSSLGIAVTGGHDVVGAFYPAGAWYFAEGTCRPDFDPYLCIQNPGSVDALIDITYMTGNGTTVVREITVARHSRSTVVVKDVLGSGDDAAHDFSVKVLSTSSLFNDDVIVERPMYFNYRSTMGVFITGGHDVVGYSP